MSDGGKPSLLSAPILGCGMCVLVILAGAAALAVWKGPVGEHAAPSVREAVKEKPAPSLYCLFFDFTHASVVVGFDFVLDAAAGAPLRFAERAQAIRKDPAVNFDIESRPIWSYSLDEDGTRTITSPDGATRVLLYGLKLDNGGVFWIEAGIRSNIFRNLDGKCLQSHFDDVGQKGVKDSVRP